ncbi:hypothetical protein F7725_005182 [Dissostichus mawsoni]|uniref:Uncharacterized protein n=1 Tax=Dissostichus mawsoni TaxID=36200 RepID=A0A7J5YTP6_DISMA|nr:hypothetical protein F7725_005182 [Dissostichus mawsoni]
MWRHEAPCGVMRRMWRHEAPCGVVMQLWRHVASTPSRCRWCSGAPVMQRGSSERAAGEELILPEKRSERTG